MPRTKVVGRPTGTGPDAAVAVQAGRAAEEDLVAVPEPDAQPNQRPRLGSDDRPDARQPRPRHRREQRQEDLDQQCEPAVPAPDAAGRPRSELPGGARPRHVAGACVDGRFPLAERQVTVGADVRGQEAIVATAARAVKHQDRPERAVEVAASPAV